MIMKLKNKILTIINILITNMIINGRETMAIPKNSIYNRNYYNEFLRLEIDWNTKTIDKNDLPKDLSKEACDFINLFRRKTHNETREWNIYLDYETGEIIHCFIGEGNSVKGIINTNILNERKILTIHNHPKDTYSPPSATNFEILEHEFEDYEIICSYGEYWILESKEKIDLIVIKKIKQEIKHIFIECENLKESSKTKKYEKELINFINNLKINISLTKKEYR